MEPSSAVQPISCGPPDRNLPSTAKPPSSHSDDQSVENRDESSSKQQYPSDATKPDSQMWQNAIYRYYDELKKGGVKGPAIDKDLWNIKSPIDLLDQIRALEPSDARTSRAWLGSLRRLETILLSLNDFASVTAWALGMNGKVAAVFWGSIRLLLNLAQPVLPEILDMLEELRRTLPRYKKYEQELPMTKALEDGLSDMYTEIIIFCARAITFFRNNPNIGRSRHAWSQFNSEFLRTVATLRNHSRRVDEEADMIRMTREASSAEMVHVMKNLKDTGLGDEVKLPCHMIPNGLNPRFFGRSEEVAKIGDTLNPEKDDDQLKVIAIHGLGGVGKTQIALQYANTSLKLYDAIAWISSETQIKITQGLSSFAKKLGLAKGDDAKDDSIASVKVRDWLNTSNCRFLLIFDNVDQIELLLQIWPGSVRGSIIMTTRSSSVAAKRATNLLHLQSFGAQTGPETLCSLTGMVPTNDDERGASEEICHLLGGLPLAIAQISEFIRNRGYSYKEFLTIYRHSSAKIHARGETPIEYNHTLSTVWDISLQKLSRDASVLQSLLTFFDPDKIEERLLKNPNASLTPERLQFLTDDFEFGEATGELIRLSLVNRASAIKSLSVHRLVQNAVFARIPQDEIQELLDSTINLLSNGFPNTWNELGAYQGHGFSAWETCGEVLPHISSLIELVKRYKLKASEPESFAELVFRAGNYLWERDQAIAARSFLKFGLSLDIDRQGEMCNRAVRLLGNIFMDLAQPRAALEAFQETLALRLKLVSPDDPIIANVYDSIACSYTEMDNANKALEYLDMANEIHLACDPKGMSRTKACYAMAYMRTKDYDTALSALEDCWHLQNRTQESIITSKYPKHSGDILLLARIRYGQGDLPTALELTSKCITMRKGVLGNKGPRVADSMFFVATMLRETGKEAAAAQLLREIVHMSLGVKEMEAHLARALWNLGDAEEATGNRDEAKDLKARAKATRVQIEGRECEDEDTDEGFHRLVAFFLW